MFVSVDGSEDAPDLEEPPLELCARCAILEFMSVLALYIFNERWINVLHNGSHDESS